MKSVKMLSLALVLFFFGANTTFAQSQEVNLTDEQKEQIEKSMEEYLEVLNLSEEQKPQFEEITKKYAEEMVAVKNGGGGKMSKYKKVKSIRKNKNKEMEELLSEEQYEIYLEKQEEMQKKAKEQRNK